MKCENCGAWVDPNFAFAIKNNQCPACGKEIMNREQLASYLSLVELLNTTKVSGSAELATLIVANFDVKQKFVMPAAQMKHEVNSPISMPEATQDMVVTQDETAGPNDAELSKEDADKTFDEEYKKSQMKDAKEKLKQLRDQLYEEAIKESWGLGDVGQGVLIPDGDSVLDTVQQMKKDQSHQNIVSGTRGSFRRG